MSTASPHPAHEHALRHVARLSAGPPIDSRLRGHRQRSPGPLDRDGLLVMQALARDRGLPQPVRCRNQQPRAGGPPAATALRAPRIRYATSAMCRPCSAGGPPPRSSDVKQKLAERNGGGWTADAGVRFVKTLGVLELFTG